MKTIEPKRNTITKRSKKNAPSPMAVAAVAAAVAKGGYQLSNSKPGLKEQVKAGLMTAKQALQTLSKKGTDAQYSDTYRWLQKRASKESSRAEANIEVQG